MPRPKTIRINAAELKIWQELADELSEHPLFKECNFDCIGIVSKESSRPEKRVKWENRKKIKARPVKP